MLTQEFWMVQMEYMGRILLAGICGGIIGYERKNRGKVAGLRTHIIVSIAAALMMIISKYGFADLTAIDGIKGADGSRIASQIVTGVGFIGAGMIFVHKNTIKGLTTAAGVWATSGIGMAVGAGMYFVGVMSTLLIFFFQILLHKDFSFLKSSIDESLYITIEKNYETLNEISDFFTKNDIHVDNLSMVESNDSLKLEIEINTEKVIYASDIVKSLSNPDDVKFISYSK